MLIQTKLCLPFFVGGAVYGGWARSQIIRACVTPRFHPFTVHLPLGTCYHSLHTAGAFYNIGRCFASPSTMWCGTWRGLKGSWRGSLESEQLALEGVPESEQLALEGVPESEQLALEGVPEVLGPDSEQLALEGVPEVLGEVGPDSEQVAPFPFPVPFYVASPLHVALHVVDFGLVELGELDLRGLELDLRRLELDLRLLELDLGLLELDLGLLELDLGLLELDLGLLELDLGRLELDLRRFELEVDLRRL